MIRLEGAVDTHTHLAPKLSALDCDACSVDIVDGRYSFDGNVAHPQALYDSAALLEHLDRHGLARAVVSMSTPFFRQHLPRNHCASWVRRANLGMLAATASSERLVPLIYLPLEYPTQALREYDFFRDYHELAGWVVSAGGRSTDMDSRSLEELWAHLDGRRDVVFLHPGISPDPRLADYYLTNLTGNPVESAIAVGRLVFGGVLNRFPGIRFLVAHCGGATPMLVGRWQHGLSAGRPEIPRLALKPEAAVRRLYVDSIAHSKAALSLAVEIMGEDKIVLGSDWPYSMGASNPWGSIEHLPSTLQSRIGYDNARTLFEASRQRAAPPDADEPMRR
jgi:aminocarboxymuconate-semialdehyde decarboxylase